MKSKKIRKVVLRAILISTLVYATNINIIANKGSFSIFTSSAQGSAIVKTADTWDIIMSFNIVEEYGQQFIVIEPGNFLNDNSIVYFEVTGEAAAYITHINPVALSRDKTPMNGKTMQWDRKSRSLSISKNKQYFISDEGKFYIPICTNINIWQKASLSSKNDFQGNIKLRYLNGFINIDRPVLLSGEYLNNRWHSGPDYYFWEDARNRLYTSNIGFSKNIGSSITSLETEDIVDRLMGKTMAVNELQEDLSNNFLNKFKRLFNGALDKEQIEIIDSIAEGYRKYVSDLEVKNKEVLKQLETTQKEKEKLLSEIEALTKGNIALSNELLSQIKALKAENEELQAIIDELRSTTPNPPVTPINPPEDNKTGEGNNGEVGAVDKSVAEAKASTPSNVGITAAVSNGTGN